MSDITDTVPLAEINRVTKRTVNFDDISQLSYTGARLIEIAKDYSFILFYIYIYI